MNKILSENEIKDRVKALGKKNIHIAAGMFNRPFKLKTIANIFTKGKLDYYKLDRHIPKFKRYS